MMVVCILLRIDYLTGTILKKVIIIPGSQRKQSINRRLASYLQSLLNAYCHADILDVDTVDLPLFNQDLENNDEVLAKVQAVYRPLRNADGLIVVSPEYNGSYSPFLKNTVDWISRLPRLPGGQEYRNPFHGKPLLLASATPGRSGGLLGLQSTRNLFAYLGSLILAEQISLPHANDAWDEAGLFIDPSLDTVVENALQAFLNLIESTTIFPRGY